MTARLAVALLLFAVPAFGQSRVYTNADLGNIQRTRTVTEEELASLRAHQYVYVPERPQGPEVIVVGGSTSDGPFGPFAMSAREPLGDPLLVDGFGGWYHGVRGPVVSRMPNMVSIAPPAPAQAVSGGRRRRGTRD